jgi:hypothetical protein
LLRNRHAEHAKPGARSSSLSIKDLIAIGLNTAPAQRRSRKLYRRQLKGLLVVRKLEIQSGMPQERPLPTTGTARGAKRRPRRPNVPPRADDLSW